MQNDDLAIADVQGHRVQRQEVTSGQACRATGADNDHGQPDLVLQPTKFRGRPASHRTILMRRPSGRHQAGGRTCLP